MLPSPTDIGHYSGRVLRELSKLCEVTVWTESQNVDPQFAPGVEVRTFHPDTIDLLRLSKSGPVVYNIGNNGQFHAGIYRMSQKIPGVVVLHEADLHSLFTYQWLIEDQNPAEYISYLGTTYGKLGEAYAKARLRGIPLEGQSYAYPIVEPALAGALAVVSHTEQASAVARRLQLPVMELPLPYAASAVRRDMNRSGPLRLVQFGYLNPHRRLDEILRALSAHASRNLFHFDIFGRLWDESYLREQVAALDLGGIVNLHGFVDEETLNDAVQQADLVFNLRYPTIGEASGTQLRIWDNVAPSVVTNHGWFAGLPDTAVLKIAPGNEGRGIANLLDRLVEDRHAYDELGVQGKQLLERDHSPERYAQRILEFLEGFDSWEKERARSRLDQRQSVLSRSLFG